MKWVLALFTLTIAECCHYGYHHLFAKNENTVKTRKNTLSCFMCRKLHLSQYYSWLTSVAYLSPQCLECCKRPQSHSIEAWPAADHTSRSRVKSSPSESIWHFGVTL